MLKLSALALLGSLWVPLTGPLGSGLSVAHADPGTRNSGPDRDGDGVPDEIDRCPDRAGPLANLGCPDRDEDHDGIIDRLDSCPTVPGSRANRGCPDGASADAAAQGGAPAIQSGQPGQPGAQNQPGLSGQQGGPDLRGLATLRGKRFEWPEPITFDPGRETLTERGRTEVEATARAILAHPDVQRLVVEGHVDEPGNSAARARELSKRRADTVKKALVQYGVPAERLRTEGYGYSRLLDRSETKAAQQRNNRIEIVVPE